MAQLVDTHCHLDFPNYTDDLDKVIENAASSGVVRIVNPGASLSSSKKAVELAQKYPTIFAGIGIHPHDADSVTPEDILVLQDMALSSDKIVAIGEIGLDNYRKYSKPENQKKLFRDQLRIARNLDLPVILHNRKASKDFLEILKEEGPFSAGGVVHCFEEDGDLLMEVLALGLHISFTGNITFKKANLLRDTIKQVPIERLMLETDSPYIAPVPLRGKRNEPAYVKYLLEIHSEIYGKSPDEIAEITTHNANELFGLGLEEGGKIAYEIRDSVYLNITNRCTNRCTFCTRDSSDFVKGHNLKLDIEPTADEVIEAIGDASKYDQVVFCGYGEPTLRLETIKKVASFVRGKGPKVRLTTNGEGDLINSKQIAPLLKGLVDMVSVSLNSSYSEEYQTLCQPAFGKQTHASILSFISDCKDQGMEVEITCLDMIGSSGVDKCQKIASDLGVNFRLRHLDVVG